MAQCEECLEIGVSTCEECGRCLECCDCEGNAGDFVYDFDGEEDE